MTPFTLRNGEWFAEDVPLASIAERFGTPCYVYSRAALTEAFLAYDRAFEGAPHLVCYAMKANSNLAVLHLFAALGGGFDIVSGGELQRVLAAGGDPGKVVFSGVGKSCNDIRFALKHDILCFNVESASELRRISEEASRIGRTARVSLRVNPDVDAKTHPYISTGLRENKFGVDFGDALPLYREAARLPGVEVAGIDCHIGSQITELMPFIDAAAKVLQLVDALAADGIPLQHIDVGGGLGIRYSDEAPPHPAEYIKALREMFAGRDVKILTEPGRSLVGNAGLLLTRIEYLKPGPARNFAIVDAAMNDLMRPALYDAYHDIIAVRPGTSREATYEVVGPVCESGDFLGRERSLAVKEGDLLAVLSAGAYGMSMASNYNSRPRAAEVMVDGDRIHLARAREPVETLFAGESPVG